jgi:hypothetical protein
MRARLLDGTASTARLRTRGPGRRWRTAAEGCAQKDAIGRAEASRRGLQADWAGLGVCGEGRAEGGGSRLNDGQDRTDRGESRGRRNARQAGSKQQSKWSGGASSVRRTRFRGIGVA